MASHRAFLEAAIQDSNANLPTKVQVPGTNTVAMVPPPPRPTTGRKLVTIRRVAAVEQLTKTYGLATVDGWKILVLNAEGFQPDELVVFCEVDSFLSHKSPYCKLFEPWGTLQTLNGEEGWRIATQQMVYPRGSEKIEVISQGRIFKLKQFPTIVRDFRALKIEATRAGHTSFEDFLRQIDFADTLGVKKWVPKSVTPADRSEAPGIAAPSAPVTPSGLAAAPTSTAVPSSAPVATSLSNPKTPFFVPSTKMERHQNCPNLFIKPKYRRYIYQQTAKLDGSAMSVYFVMKKSRFFDQLPLLNSQTLPSYLNNCVFENGRVGICSSNKDIVYSDNSVQGFISTAIGLNLPKLLAKIGYNIVLQGELVGHNILGNPYGYADPDKTGAGNKAGDCGNGHDFFLYSITDLDTGKKWSPKAVEVFATQYGVRHVPVLDYVKVPDVANNHDELQALADAAPGEGLVFKCLADGRAFKVLSTKWILEKGDEVIARGERLREHTAVHEPRPVIDPLAHARNMPVEMRRILESQAARAPITAKQTTVSAPVAANKKQTTVATPVAVKKATVATPTVPKQTAAPVVAKQTAVAASADVKQTTTASQVAPSAPDFASRAIPAWTPWEKNQPNRLHFQAWAFGHDSQNLVKWVDAWVNNKMTSEAYEAAKRKHDTMKSQLAAHQHELNVLFAAKKAAELNLEVQTHRRNADMGEFPDLIEPPKETWAKFGLDCAAEDSSSDVSGIDQSPEAETNTNPTTAASPTPSEAAPRPEVKAVTSTSAPGKKPMVSKETIAWLGL
ncbi:hypothetical protein QBC40DRAFT_231016 [Triangularia verruculosa]|uniref:RNA ligase domain-containing protein n=1 Tax=Triangularia verruculosa TaxID=2587418 RepID=A0AAN6XEL2_9PEZI|nr:hypothetical protein QBC40DRAFT_231016 [Triangularia verruculosa]